MDQCRSIAKFIILSTFIGVACSASIDTTSDLVNSQNIVEDIIPDAENSTLKVIRVNTVDLPPLQPGGNDASDSSLFKIQSLVPPSGYVSSRSFRKQKNISKPTDSPIIRQYPQLKLSKPKRTKQKQLHLLYNQKGYDGENIGKRMKVRVAPGAYPIYYVLAKTNGVFQKQPIKGFRNQQELDKYFDKVEKIGKVNKQSS